MGWDLGGRVEEKWEGVLTFLGECVILIMLNSVIGIVHPSS